jgi:hypothetical protein
MIKQFVSPNLKYNNGKIYYLNKSEINNKDHNYVQENYYYYLSEINKDFDDCSIELVVNDYNDDILVKCNVNDDLNDDSVKVLFNNINTKICNLENHGKSYEFCI